MSYKTLLVHIDNAQRCAARLRIATELAQRFDAHLIGLHALASARLPIYAVAELPKVDAETQQRLENAEGELAHQLFRDVVDKAGIAGAEWRSSLEDAADMMISQARYADLVVIGQPGIGDELCMPVDFAHRVVLEAGRPVLFVPCAGEPAATIGKRILVGWNGGREATRALTDAIPMLREADEVTVLSIDPELREHGDDPGADIALYLARHGVDVTATAQTGPEAQAAEQLLSFASGWSADLLVMGAYGHSRLKEWVLGGTTREILSSMTVPVLMSH